MYKQLISEQRYTIFILLQNGTKKKDIAKAINVSPSTVSREIKRNSGHNGHYNWETAQRNLCTANAGNRAITALMMRWRTKLSDSLKKNNGLPFRFPAIFLSRRNISHTKPYTALYERTSVMEALYTRTAVIGWSTVLGQLEANGYRYLIVSASVNVL